MAHEEWAFIRIRLRRNRTRPISQRQTMTRNRRRIAWVMMKFPNPSLTNWQLPWLVEVPSFSCCAFVLPFLWIRHWTFLLHVCYEQWRTVTQDRRVRYYLTRKTPSLCFLRNTQFKDVECFCIYTDGKFRYAICSERTFECMGFNKWWL